MTDKNIKAKQSLIQQLRDVAEKETAWLEQNRLLYTQKREQLEGLIKERGLTGGEVTPEDKSLVSMLPCMNLDAQVCGTWLKR